MESKEELMLLNDRKVNLTRLIIMISFALILVMGVLGFEENAHAQETPCMLCDFETGP